MLEHINEPIDVIAKFIRLRPVFGGQVGNQVLPVKFLWQGREVLVKKVNLAYSHFEGRTKLYFFAVSDSVNYFKLQFNTENLSWTLLESYAE